MNKKYEETLVGSHHTITSSSDRLEDSTPFLRLGTILLSGKDYNSERETLN
jgi:hypothetical protein